MVRGYENGTTPNPDVLCNRYIKFGAFFKHAIHTLGKSEDQGLHHLKLSLYHLYYCEWTLLVKCTVIWCLKRIQTLNEDFIGFN